MRKRKRRKQTRSGHVIKINFLRRRKIFFGILLFFCRYAYTINLGGERFKIKTAMLENVQHSLLNELSPAHSSYDWEAEEYFFDPSAALFTFVYDHLEGMDVHFPHCFCPKNICHEIKFWRLPAEVLSPCCSRRLTEHLDQEVCHS